MFASHTREELVANTRKVLWPAQRAVTVRHVAVKTTIEVVPPGNPDSQFFQVKFGE